MPILKREKEPKQPNFTTQETKPKISKRKITDQGGNK